MNIDIDSILDERISKLKNDVDKFKRSEKDGLYLIKNLFDPDKHQPYYTLVSNLIRDNGNTHRQLQDHLANIVIQYLKSVDSSVDVKLSHSNSYPSNFSINKFGYEIISFDIYTHRFRVGKGVMSDNSSVEEIKRLEERYDEVNESLWKYAKYEDNLFSVIKKENYNISGIKVVLPVIRDLFYILFETKKLKQGLQKTISKYQKEKERILDDIKKIEKDRLERNKYREDVEEATEYWRQWFLNIGYKELDKHTYL